jgi:hypothetical protein
MIGLHPLCAVLFFAGYVLREYGAFDYVYTGSIVTLMTFILSQVFIYICPWVACPIEKISLSVD